jgi:hypothetical protein
MHIHTLEINKEALSLGRFSETREDATLVRRDAPID